MMKFQIVCWSFFTVLRTVDAQVQLLSSLPPEDELLEENVQERFQDIQQQNSSSIQFGKTPSKQKLGVTRYWDEEKSSVEGTSGDTKNEGIGMSQTIEGIIRSMDEIQEEEFGSTTADSSMHKSVAELAYLVQVQGNAIKSIETGTNAMTSRVEAGVVGLKADVGSRLGNSDELPGLQIWEIVGAFSRRMDSMVTEMNQLLVVVDPLLGLRSSGRNLVCCDHHDDGSCLLILLMFLSDAIFESASEL
jgi:hypothetical protein